MPIDLLSAGAVSPGLVKVIDAFRSDTGHEINVTFATAPEIRNALREGKPVDVLIAPIELISEKITDPTAIARIGRVGVGVAVRDGTPEPRLSTVDEFRRVLLAAESIVYNQASTGTYLENLFERLGISTEIAGKTVRYPNFGGVRDHIAHGKGREIGLGATTVIIESKGIKFVAELPADIQNYTTYAATVIAATGARAATDLYDFLGSPAAQAIFRSAGIL